MPTLSRPTRISRLYPAFALTLALSTAVLAYAWGSAEIELTDLSQTYSQRDANLRQQVLSLTADSKDSHAKLAVQQQQITDTAAKLAALQKQQSTLSSQLGTTTQQLATAQNQLSSNASELQTLRSRPPLFSFADQSSLPDVSVKEAAVRSLVSSAYGYIQGVYGQPYLLDSIKITFVKQYDIAGSAGEILISNGPKGISIDIHLKDFNPDDFQDNNTVVHEMIHAFHGVAVFQTSAIEEGETVAATDAVMAKMTADGKLPNFGHLYLQTPDSEYRQLDSSLSIRADNVAFYSDPNISRIYQVIGTAWYKMYQEDPQIFSAVNAEYYPHVQNGQTASTALALQAIRDNLKSVSGVPHRPVPELPRSIQS